VGNIYKFGFCSDKNLALLEQVSLVSLTMMTLSFPFCLAGRLLASLSYSDKEDLRNLFEKIVLQEAPPNPL
jgi:hypothetical protein